MIRHIVVWGLKAERADARAASIAAITAALEPLADTVPVIRSIRVHANAAMPERNRDVVLIADFDSVDDLAAYVEHPLHVAAAAIVTAHVGERASIDIELP